MISHIMCCASLPKNIAATSWNNECKASFREKLSSSELQKTRFINEKKYRNILI